MAPLSAEIRRALHGSRLPALHIEPRRIVANGATRSVTSSSVTTRAEAEASGGLSFQRRLRDITRDVPGNSLSSHESASEHSQGFNESRSRNVVDELTSPAAETAAVAAAEAAEFYRQMAADNNWRRLETLLILLVALSSLYFSRTAAILATSAAVVASLIIQHRTSIRRRTQLHTRHSYAKTARVTSFACVREPLAKFPESLELAAAEPTDWSGQIRRVFSSPLLASSQMGHGSPFDSEVGESNRTGTASLPHGPAENAAGSVADNAAGTSRAGGRAGGTSSVPFAAESNRSRAILRTASHPCLAMASSLSPLPSLSRPPSLSPRPPLFPEPSVAGFIDPRRRDNSSCSPVTDWGAPAAPAERHVGFTSLERTAEKAYDSLERSRFVSCRVTTSPLPMPEDSHTTCNADAATAAGSSSTGAAATDDDDYACVSPFFSSPFPLVGSQQQQHEQQQQQQHEEQRGESTGAGTSLHSLPRCRSEESAAPSATFRSAAGRGGSYGLCRDEANEFPNGSFTGLSDGGSGATSQRSEGEGYMREGVFEGSRREDGGGIELVRAATDGVMEARRARKFTMAFMGAGMFHGRGKERRAGRIEKKGSAREKNFEQGGSGGGRGGEEGVGNEGERVDKGGGSVVNPARGKGGRGIGSLFISSKRSRAVGAAAAAAAAAVAPAEEAHTGEAEARGEAAAAAAAARARSRRRWSDGVRGCNLAASADASADAATSASVISAAATAAGAVAAAAAAAAGGSSGAEDVESEGPKRSGAGRSISLHATPVSSPASLTTGEVAGGKKGKRWGRREERDGREAGRREEAEGKEAGRREQRSNWASDSLFTHLASVGEVERGSSVEEEEDPREVVATFSPGSWEQRHIPGGPEAAAAAYEDGTLAPIFSGEVLDLAPAATAAAAPVRSTGGIAWSGELGQTAAQARRLNTVRSLPLHQPLTPPPSTFPGFGQQAGPANKRLTGVPSPGRHVYNPEQLDGTGGGRSIKRQTAPSPPVTLLPPGSSWPPVSAASASSASRSPNQTPSGAAAPASAASGPSGGAGGAALLLLLLLTLSFLLLGRVAAVVGVSCVLLLVARIGQVGGGWGGEIGRGGIGEVGGGERGGTNGVGLKGGVGEGGGESREAKEERARAEERRRRQERARDEARQRRVAEILQHSRCSDPRTLSVMEGFLSRSTTATDRRR
ncbi:hypothetical protein CLOM_g3832 [Closterium sp. NIES-68]|nr:hypothetical protein CLOM_g3832 [Closterium sp. NIES-68]GJP68144.1 hypothetical protein CLOP_g24884 [Closterium sp. NIES-67]GJP70690.1 hypothetical protein CLOP_g1602 [Closterium sp. NIES-67]